MAKTIPMNNPILMFYNVENLFYPKDYPQKNWTEQRYHLKLKKISEVIEGIGKKYGSLPLLIGLCEIQQEQSILDLLALPTLSHYHYIYSESEDERGMDTALLYDKKQIEILQHHDFSASATRNILYCKIKLGKHILHTYTLHLPSKRDFDKNKALRKKVLENLKKIIQKNWLHSEEFVVILGDFNANPNDEDILNIMQIGENNRLFNPFSALYGEHIFSTFHHNRGLLFDQILISENFLDNDSELKYINAEIFSAEEIKKQGKPFRTFAGTRYLGGYSDHFPAILELKI